MARQVVTSVQCAGKVLAPGFDFQHLALTQSLFDQPSFSLLLPFDRVESSTAAFFSQAPRQLLGKDLTIEIASAPGFVAKPEPGLKFKGLITGLGTSKDTDYANSVSVNGYGPTYLLADGLQKRTFLNQTLAAIFEQVLSPYGATLPNSLQPRHKEPLAYVVQYRETDFTFLSRLASEYDEWFYYDGLTLQLGPPPTDGAPVEFVADGVYNTFHLSLELQPMRVKLYDYNYEQHQHFTSLTSSQRVPEVAQHPFGQVVLEQSENLFRQESHAMAEMPIASTGQLNDEAKSLKAHRVADLVVLQGQSDNPALQLGRVVQVSGIGLGSQHITQDGFGLYRLIELTHHIDAQGNYRNSFTAIPHLLNVPPANPYYAPPTGTSELAEVIANDDPQKLGRLRVRYHWPVKQPKSAETGWLRLLTPYSGDGKGHMFKPEVGSQVLVDYQAGLAEQPYVLGNFFHARNKQNATYSPPQNNLKGIQTAGGNKVVMSDVAGAQTILLSNSNKKTTAITVSFENDGKVHIQSAGPVAVNGSTITLEAGAPGQQGGAYTGDITLKAKTITLEAEEAVKIESITTTVALAAKTDLTADAKGSLTLTAVKTAALSGTERAGLLSPDTVDVGQGTTVNIAAGIINQS